MEVALLGFDRLGGSCYPFGQGVMRMTTLTLSDQAADLVKAGVALQHRLLKTSCHDYRQRLQTFERRYRMTTKRFLHRFHAGKLADDAAWCDWLFASQAHTQLSQRLSVLRGIKL